MKEKNEFSKRIVFIYNYFKSHCADFGVSKPTKEAFITFLGISRGKLQSWERGYWPKDEDLQSISQKMRLSFAWLAFGTGEPFDVQDTRPVQTAGMDAMQSATGHDIDPLRRMTQAIGIPEDAWSISDYLGIPAADAGAYIQKVMACRQSQPPQSLPLPELWREAARRRHPGVARLGTWQESRGTGGGRAAGAAHPARHGRHADGARRNERAGAGTYPELRQARRRRRGGRRRHETGTVCANCIFMSNMRILQ